MTQKIDIEKDIAEYCKTLKIPSIKQNYKSQINDNISFEMYLHKLLELECISRAEHAKQNRLRLANFPYKKYIENLELDCLPEDGRNKLKTFLSLDFIKDGQNIILAGNPGTR